MPCDDGVFSQPSTDEMEYKSPMLKKVNNDKPKRVFAYGGGSSAFALAMRTEMGRDE